MRKAGQTFLEWLDKIKSEDSGLVIILLFKNVSEVVRLKWLFRRFYVMLISCQINRSIKIYSILP